MISSDKMGTLYKLFDLLKLTKLIGSFLQRAKKEKTKRYSHCNITFVTDYLYSFIFVSWSLRGHMRERERDFWANPAH